MMNRVWACSAGVLALSFIAMPVYPDAGDPELFRMLINARTDNIERILTWRGKATLEGTVALDDGTMEVESFQLADFAYDRNLNAVRWNVVVLDRKYAKPNPITITASNPENHHALLKDGLFWRLETALIKRDGTRSNMLAVVPREGQPIHGFSSDFDPTWYFTEAGEDIDDYLKMYYEKLDNPSFNHWSMSRDGDVISWQVNGPDSSVLREFDLSKGGNLVRTEAKDPYTENHYSWVFENVGGVWVPSSFEFRNRQISSTGDVRRVSRRIVFTNNEVNVPLADDEFTLERLGVEPGTPVSDHVRGVAYKYGDKVVSVVGLPSAKDLEAEALQHLGDDVAVPVEAVALPDRGRQPAAIESAAAEPYLVPGLVAVALLASLLGYRVLRRRPKH